MGGDLVAEAARAGGGELIPIDSEHSAVLQCLTGQSSRPNRIVLTASGGPFRDRPMAAIAAATVDEALNHPTWEMGAKITVDSATLANKALEVIEAHFLFDLQYDQIDVVVHPQSIVHAFVEFDDGSVLAQMGFPSMEIPILYALTHPGRSADAGTRRFNPVTAGDLTFESVRHEAFPTFGLGVSAGRSGGTAPAVFNAANEVAVAAFLEKRIEFGRIPVVIEAALAGRDTTAAVDLGTLRAADAQARAHALEAI